jgi:hypothetical protein
MPLSSLEQVARVLSRKIDVPAVYNSINTRLIIQIGINLKKIAPQQNNDPAVVRRVLAALQAMGFTLEEAS